MQISDSFNRKPHLFEKSITIAETRMKNNNQGNTITKPQSNRSSHNTEWVTIILNAIFKCSVLTPAM